MKIFKYSLPTPNDAIEILMPRGAKILCVQVQNGTACIWALVDPARQHVARKIRWAGTGHEIDFKSNGWNGNYIGTFQMADGALVWHLFDLGEA